MTVHMRRQTPRAHFGERHDQPLHRVLGLGDFGAGHLREILALQHLAVGHRHARVELDLALFFQSVVEAGIKRFMDARRARLWAACGAAAGACGIIIAMS